MHVCMMHISMIIILCMHVINILDPDACVYDLQCMMHISIHISMILDPVACMNVWSLTLMFVCMMHTLLILIQVAMMHICMMHLSMILDPVHACMMHVFFTFDPWPWYMYVWCIHLLSLIMMHMCMMHLCMMHTSVILDPWLWCMCVWCGWNFVTDQRTNEQGDSRSRMVDHTFEESVKKYFRCPKVHYMPPSP